MTELHRERDDADATRPAPAGATREPNRVCDRCGQPFRCGADDTTCWCVSLPPLPSSAIDPRIACLCPACLRARIEAARASG